MSINPYESPKAEPQEPERRGPHGVHPHYASGRHVNIQGIKDRLVSEDIFLSEDSLAGKPTVVGYDKQFRWRWFATQLNTFFVAADFGDDTVTVNSVERLLNEAFGYAKKHYTGWPRGFQSGLGVIAVLLSSRVEDEAIRYCKDLKAGKKWAGFSVPVAVDTTANQVFSFDHNPLWGRIYYPQFKKMIKEIVM